LHVGLLLGAGARVLVVAPDLDDVLAGLAARGQIIARRRSYRAEDLDDAWLVLACASQDGINARAAADAEQRRIWCVSGRDAAALPRMPPLPGLTASSVGPGAGVTSTPARSGRRVLVLGGARSGKSAAAESMLADARAVEYVATGQLAGSGDAEWDQRVREHQARRLPGWRTVETLDIARVLAMGEAALPVLVDCLATWLARIMDDCGLWSGDPEADARLAEHLGLLVAAWRQTTRPAVAVSNEVGSGIVPATSSGRRFRDELGRLNSRIAAVSDEVWICTAGIPLRLR